MAMTRRVMPGIPPPSYGGGARRAEGDPVETLRPVPLRPYRATSPIAPLKALRWGRERTEYERQRIPFSRRTDPGTEAAEQFREAGEAGVDGGAVVDRHPIAGGDAEDEEGHGDAVVEMGHDHAAAGGSGA